MVLKSRFKMYKITKRRRRNIRRSMMRGKVAMLEWGQGVWLSLHCWWLQVLLLFSLNFHFLLSCMHSSTLHRYIPGPFLIPWNPLHSDFLPRALALIPYESLKFFEKFSGSGLPFLITGVLKVEESYPIGFNFGRWP